MDRIHLKEEKVVKLQGNSCVVKTKVPNALGNFPFKKNINIPSTLLTPIFTINTNIKCTKIEISTCICKILELLSLSIMYPLRTTPTQNE